MDVRCRVELFGRLQVLQGDREISRFRTQKAAGLLAYLALNLQHSHSREQLVEVFWPEMDFDAARANLRTTLNSLRNQIEPPGIAMGSVLITDRQSVRLNSEAVSTDVAQFDRLLASARSEADPGERRTLLASATALYSGDLLPDRYEDWAVREQERCRVACQEALRTLAGLCEADGDLEPALDAARRLGRMDPFDEAACRLQMRLCAALGRHFAALECYAALEKALEAELGVAPEAETRELAETVGSGQWAGGSRQSADAAGAERVGRSLRPRPASQTETRRRPSDERPGSEGASLNRGRLTYEGPGGDVDTALRPDERDDARSLHPDERDGARSLHLPLQLTRFFGREGLVARVADLLAGEDARLVTLLGPGGIGKTRTAVEIASQATGSFNGRVWFVSLADLPMPSLVPLALIRAMRLPAGDDDPLDRVAEALGTDDALLVLDNFEHLLLDADTPRKNDNPAASGAIHLVRLLLEQAPGLRCLITSRLPLRLGGERLVSVPPLDVPNPTSRQNPAELMANEAVSLFVNRAQCAVPDFTLTTGNALAVAAVCRKLDGIPLAIEMAAAWVRLLPPPKLLERLERQLDFPASRQRDLAERHRSLRAIFTWSYGQLSDAAQSLFAELAVFRGGWTPEAAEAVSGLDAFETLEALAELRESSLIHEVGGREEGRYRLLEPLRELAEELRPAEDEMRAQERRHAQFYAGLVEVERQRAGDGGRAVWLRVVDGELENLRGAIAWCAAHDDGADIALRLAVGLGPYWIARSYLREGRSAMEALLPRARTTGPSPALAAALDAQGMVLLMQAERESGKQLCEEALNMARETGARRTILAALSNLAGTAIGEGRGDDAYRLYAEILGMERKEGSPRSVAQALTNLGVAAFITGDCGRSRELHEEARSLAAAIPVPDLVALAGLNIGIAAAEQGDLAGAREALAESLRYTTENGFTAWMLSALERMGCVARLEDQPERAAQIWGACARMREEHGTMVAYDEQPTLEAHIAAARAHLGSQKFKSHWSAGAAFTRGELLERVGVGPDICAARQQAHAEPPSYPSETDRIPCR